MNCFNKQAGVLDVTADGAMRTLKGLTVNPLLASMMVGGGLWGASKMAHPLISGYVSRLYRRIPGVTEKDARELEESMVSPEVAKWLPIGIGALGGAATLGSTMDFRRGGTPYFGALSWDRTPTAPSGSGLRKTSSAMADWKINDQSMVDFQRLVPVAETKNMILNDPTIAPWQAGELVTMVNQTALRERSPQISLGGFFDTARDKLDEFLTLKGVGSATVRGIVGYGMGKVLTKAVGTMMELDPSTRTKVQDMGLFGNVITGIF